MNKFSKFLFLSVIFSLVFSFNVPKASADSITCKIDHWAQTTPGSLTVDVDWAAFVTGGGTPYDIYIDWGDGKVNQLVGKLDTSNGSADSGFVQHDYPSYGAYTILIHSGPGCRDPYPIKVDPVIVSNPLGTVCVASNVPTSWVVSGPGGAHGATGLTSYCFDDTAGSWTLGSVPTLAGYTGPVITPSTNVQNVPDGGIITWDITYSQNKYRCSGGGSCILDNVNGDTTSSNCNNSCSVSSAPTVNISASPGSISSGGSSTITWTSQNATSCSVTPTGWTGTSGSQSTGALFSTTNYIVTCSGPGGTVSNSATVNVSTSGAPLVTVSASPTGVSTGGSSVISWNITGTVTSCAASGGWSTPGTLSGSVVAGPLFSNTTFGLSCTGPGGTSSDSKTVTVSSIPPTTVTLTASPTNVSNGGSSTLTWNITGNPTACSATGAWTTPGTFSGSKSTGALSSTQTFGLVCSGPGGTASDSATVTVSSAPSSVNIKGWGPPTNSVTDGPVSITLGSTGGVSWTSTNAVYCELYQNGVFTGHTEMSPSSVGVGPINSSTGYQVNCTNGTDISSDTIIFDPIIVSAPTVSLSASPTSITNGGSSNLSWIVSGTITSCTASGAWSGAKSTTGGSQSTGALTSSQTYNISCTGPGGTSSDSVTVSVGSAPPTVSISASPTSINSGNSSTLSWSVSGSVTSCTASGGWSGSKSTTGGSQSTGALSSTQAFDITCTGPGGSSSDSVVITVIATPPPTISFSGSPSSITSGGSSTLSWSVSGSVNSCTASGGWSGSPSIFGGSQSTGPLFTSQTFNLSCTGPGGTTNANPVTVTVTGSPADLTAGPVTPTSATVGSSVVFTSTITNSGGASTGSSFNNLFQVSSDGGNTASTISFNSRATLGSGTSGPVNSSSYTFPGSGTYSVRVCADSDNNFSGTISESNEGNNCGPWTDVDVSNVAVAPTVSLSASPTSVTSGDSSTLSWTVSGTITSCTASGAWSGAKSTTGGSQSTGSISSTQTYNLSCTGPGGTTSDSVTVTVGVSAVPTVSISASPTSVASGGSSTLTWTVSGTITSCTASGAWSGAKSTTGGSQSTGSISSTQTYNLSCTGPGGTTSDSVTVTVSVPPPSITFSASPTSVTSGGSSTLSWNITGQVTSCSAIGWTTPSIMSGTQSTGSLTTSQTYNLSCTGPGGTTNANPVTVTVTGSPADLSAGPVTPTYATAGTPISFAATIYNAGGASTVSSFNNLFQVSTDGGSTASVISVNTHAVLSSGTSGQVNSSSYTFSSPGTYSVRVCADNNASFVGTVPESDEGDNCGVWTDVTVAAVSGSLPVVISPTASSITTSGATLGADVVSLGVPSAITEKGTCYGTTPNPTTNCVSAGGSMTTGAFTQARSGLTPSTTYYFRGYATNATGIGYSSDSSFTTNGLVVTGDCGSASRPYLAGDTSYGADNFCNAGTPSPASPAFPPAGGNTPWQCLGLNGGAPASCQATRAPAVVALTVSVVNPVGGKVTSNPSAINCGGTCSASITSGTQVVLTATPASSYWKFDKWGGDCAFAGNSKTCTITVTSPTDISATFIPRVFDYTEF